MDRKTRILLVDDDPDFLDSTRRMLESAGYEVAVARGEGEALIKLEAKRPDLLVLDVMMSEWDSGFQLMWHLKMEERYEDLPEDEEYLPVDGYLVKPVTVEKLLRTVEWILEHAERPVGSR